MSGSLECYGYEADNVDQVLERVPCRRSQTQQLFSLFGARHHAACPSIFIYGHASTGKTLLAKTLVQTLKLPSIFINCVETFTSRLIFEQILSHLSPPDDKQPAKCDNMNDFVRTFKKLLRDSDMDKETLYVTEANVCVILISEIVWEKFQSGTGFCEPFVLHFPDYSKDELTEILCLDCPEPYTVDFYSSYVRLVLSMFYQACRDLRELRHLALLNFGRYTEPVVNGQATCDDTHKLWRNIEPELKKALQTVYLREVSSSQWERSQQDETGQPLQGLSARTHIELPFFTKYLLIAAYLASYNPAKSDKRFFCNKSGKITRREKLIKKHERTTNHLLGPKAFPLDRLLAIFYSIVEGRVAPSANIFMQISSLVTLHLLAQVAGDDQVDSPKYRCLVSLDFISSVCRTVGFDVKRYLFDFL